MKLNGKSTAWSKKLLCVSQFVGLYFLPVFFCHEQHTETFTLILVEVFMVHFMCPSYGAYVCIIAPGKPFKPLVNDYFMHYKISKAIHSDTKANCRNCV
jgi:hypothetical protein